MGEEGDGAGWVELEVEHNMLESPEENCGLDRVGHREHSVFMRRVTGEQLIAHRRPELFAFALLERAG